jgi:hypothetical protein
VNVTDGSCRVLHQDCFSCDMHCDMSSLARSGGDSRFLCSFQATLCDCAMATDKPTVSSLLFPAGRPPLDVPWPLYIIVGG